MIKTAMSSFDLPLKNNRFTIMLTTPIISASITNSFGKGSLIALLRQFSILHSERKQVSAGFIG
jgi:hypothetical protein